MVQRHRSSVICLHNEKILGFHAEDPSSKKKYFFVPGGKIEDHESAAESAIRETLEETGYKVKLFLDAKIIKKYEFFWNGQTYLCETVFYPAVLEDATQKPLHVDDASYHRGVDWVPRSEMIKYFSYHEYILKATQDCVAFLANLDS